MKDPSGTAVTPALGSFATAMNVVVVGASGGIGNALTSLLAESDAVASLIACSRRAADVALLDDRPLGPVVAARVAKAQRKVLTDGRAITAASPAERLHDLRKDTKKLRYLLECFGSLFPAKDRKAFVAQLKALQDNLGEHQDAEVHMAQLRELAHDLHAKATVDTDALLAMGRLSDHLDRRRTEERTAFVDRFAAYDTKPNRRTLDAMLRKASAG